MDPYSPLESAEYADSYNNYQRLVDTCNYLYADSTPHPMFFVKHVQHIRVYRAVVAQSRISDPTLAQKIDALLEEYETQPMFSLIVYLEVCEQLLNIVKKSGEVDDDFIAAFGGFGLH